jgi:hypothetical protein
MNAQYQEWLKHIFDHEVRKPAWYFDDDKPEFKAPPIEIVELISQTFLRAGRDLTEYTDVQVDQGIWYLAGWPAPDFRFVLKSPKVPLKKRLEAIENIFYLYPDCFAKRCTETLGHLSEEGSALNSSCYMLWDISPITLFWDKNPFTYLEDAHDSKETQDVVLNVLKKTLNIEHRACREGAFHGLGRMAYYACPDKVHKIVDGFLSKNKLDDKLPAYALEACEGKVL